jgi:ankyrin repeat protein
MYGFHQLAEHLNLKYPQYASARGGHCGTALHSASFQGHLQVVRYLLQHDVNVNVRNSGNDTSLLLASYQGHGDVVRFLLDRGADVDLRDQYDNTPLTLAAAVDTSTPFGYYLNTMQMLILRTIGAGLLCTT